ncbi:TniB family NTP-binding protein [Streptomyces virginiae]|uniref:TniB family NTP-binding protein n=1 Tax=Streptomyces virginiae TaxID=1961 RepID=UPI0036FF4E00
MTLAAGIACQVPDQAAASGLPSRDTSRPLFLPLANILQAAARSRSRNPATTVSACDLRSQDGARRGLIISGPATTGKNTTMMALGRSFQLADARQYPGQGDRRPVLFISVPPAATPKMLVTEFARYLGIPVTVRMTQTQITDAVCHTYTQAGIRLVLIDEIHRLNPRTTTGAQTADLLKDPLPARHGTRQPFRVEPGNAGMDSRLATALHLPHPTPRRRRTPDRGRAGGDAAR